MNVRRGKGGAAGLTVGVLWGSFLLVAFGATQTFAQPALGYRAILLFLCVFVAAVHVGAVGLGAAAVGAAFRSGHAARWAIGAYFALLGGIYGLLVLSTVKLFATRSHLGVDDLRFLTASFQQITGEGTQSERHFILLSSLLLPALALVFWLVARSLHRVAAALGPRELAVVALAGLAGIGATAWRHVPARWITTTLFPDTRAVARLFLPTSGIASDPAAWRADTARQSRREPYSPGNSFRRWNVLVVMLESASWARVLGPEARAESTPHLARLAAESAVFDRAFATSTHSDYAQTSILASLHPRKYRQHDYFVDMEYPRTLLWDLFEPLGYRTAIFSCQNETWGNMRAFLETPALDLFRHAPDWPAAPRRGDAVSNQKYTDPLDLAFRGEAKETKVFEETVVSSFLDWVDRAPSQPFVAYLNFQATHFPYVAPPGFPGPYSPSEIDFPATFFSYPISAVPVMLNRWHNALAYSDQQLGRLLDGLENRGVGSRTAILVVSDHGEAFYESGFQTHGTSLREEQLRVVMLLRAPGLTPRRVAEPVSVLDALPSLLNQMGLPPHGNWQGRSDVLQEEYDGSTRPLLSTIQGLTREDSVVLGDRQFIRNWDRRESLLVELSSMPVRQPSAANRAGASERELRDLLIRLLAEQLSYYDARAWSSGYYPPRIP